MDTGYTIEQGMTAYRADGDKVGKIVEVHPD